MKKTDSVFQLIKSLTRGEKRNFRMLAQLTSGDKKYLQLFDVMDNLDEYDEEKILKKFRKDKAFEKQFAYNKNYLYNSILNALVYFHKGSEAELSSLTIQVHILLEKNLYYQAKKLLRKAKEKVYKQERFEELLKLLRYEIEILKRTENIKLLRESLRQVEFEERVTLEKISNYLAYSRLDSRVFILMKTTYMARSHENTELVKEIYDSDLLDNESRALSHRAKILFNEIQRRLATFNNKEQDALVFCDRAIELFEDKPDLQEEEKMLYLQLLSAASRHHFRVSGLDRSLKALMKIRKAKISTPFERLFRFRRFYTFLLYMHNDMGEVLPDPIMNELLKEMKALKNDLATSQRLWAYNGLAQYHFYHGDLSEALRWINDFLNHPRSAVRTDLQAMVRLVNLLLHYDLGNFDLIEYSIKSTYRFMYKQDMLNKYERRVLSFLRKAINLTNEAEVMEELQLFRNDLDEIFADPMESRAENYFNIYAWIDAKLENRPMIEVIREKNPEKILMDALQVEKTKK